jgi:4-amino-4-deoxy-L-arabinose transferase-like glycosyltransferase
MKIKQYLWLLAVMALGLVLRVYGIWHVPVSMYWDETAIAYDAYVLSETGKDMHGNSGIQAIFPSYGDYKLPLYIWSTSLVMKIFGPSIFSLRLTSAIAGTLLIGVVFLLSQQLSRSFVASILAAFILATSPWAVQFSRTGFEANLGVLLLTLALWLIIKGLRQPKYFLLAAIAGAIGVYAYFSVRFVYPLFLLVVILAHIKRITKSSLVWLTLSVLLFGLLLLPIIKSPYYQASNQFRLSTTSLLNTDDHVLDQNYYRALDDKSIISRVLYHRYYFFAKRLVNNYAAHLDPRYIFFWGDSNLRHGTGEVGLFVLPYIVVFFLAIFGMAKKSFSLLLMLLGLWIAALLPAVIPLNVPHALRSLNALPIISLIMGMGIFFWWHDAKFRFKKILMILLIVGIFINTGLYIHDYWTHYSSRSAADWQYGYEQVVSYLASIESDYEKINITDSDGRMFLYFLFFNQVSPTTSWRQSTDFQVLTIDNYEFKKIMTHEVLRLDPEQLFVLIPNEYRDLHQELKIKHTFYDKSGEPQFLVIATDEQS